MDNKEERGRYHKRIIEVEKNIDNIKKINLQLHDTLSKFHEKNQAWHNQCIIIRHLSWETVFGFILADK